MTDVTKVIVIVASPYDVPAHRLSERWAGHGCCLLTSEDLSICGWRYHLSDPLASTAILGGRKVKQSEISGVLTRLPWVWEGELRDIASEDRAYVAGEMSAFLLCWLSDLRCPVVNRPTPSCLNGPAWSREQWTASAAKAGMRIQATRRRTSVALPAEAPPASEMVTVTVVGKRCLGEADESLLIQAQRLAEAAGTELLGVQFSSAAADATFLQATAYPDVGGNGVNEAVLERLGVSNGS